MLIKFVIMVRAPLFNSIFFMILFSVGIAISYEEHSVYTQAILTITFSHVLDKTVVPSGHQQHKYSGKYGEESPKANAGGALYYAGEKVTWCESFEPVITKFPWIALIPKVTNCTEQKQISLAMKYNASAAIIYNNEPIELPVMADHNPNMVSVMISKESGDILTGFMRDHASEVVNCDIVVGTHYVDRRWKVSRTSVLFVLVSFILLVCISLAWLVFYYVQRFRHRYRNDRKDKLLLNAAKKAISKLKTISFQPENRDEEDDACAVCLEIYKNGENLRVLPCKHWFHKNCIDPWLLNHRTCPMCKTSILYEALLKQYEKSDNMTLSDHDVQSNIETRHNAESPTTSVGPLINQQTVNSEQISMGITTQDWCEQEASGRYSSSSSSISDTDSERSTVMLVSSAQYV